MSPQERARHLYICGATRTGKSKLLEDLIRQDILAWPRSGCGMLVLDRHGSLYDGVMKWAAALDLSSWPIVPIDLRRSDYVVSYNPLRRRGRGEEDSVVVGNLLRSILHAWGQSDPSRFGWYEAPEPESMAAAEQLLVMLGALDGAGGTITRLGRRLLDIPAHKTGTAFTKPMDPLLGQAIEAWQAVRPGQPEGFAVVEGALEQFGHPWPGSVAVAVPVHGSQLPLITAAQRGHSPLKPNLVFQVA